MTEEGHSGRGLRNSGIRSRGGSATMAPMHVALTGATGFIGSHVLTELREHGHDVTALVRNDDQAQVVAARGASEAVVDLYDRPAVVGRLRSADAAIHTASPGDATSADLDAAMVDAAIEAFAGTGKPYLHISGAWVYGANPAITEESPFDPPAMVAWREPIERRRARRERHARRRHRLRRRVRRRRGRGSRTPARLTPRRRRQPDHARHRTPALGDRPCRRPGGLLPARARRRLGSRLLRDRRWREPDGCRAHRGGGGRGRRARGGPRLRR